APFETGICHSPSRNNRMAEGFLSRTSNHKGMTTMYRYLLAGATALTLVAGSALAQNSVTVITPSVPSVSNSTTTQTTTDSATGAVSKSREQSSVDANGREVHKSESYNAGAGHVDHSSSTAVKNPDGSTVTTNKKEWSNTGPRVESHTTTTTT